MADLPRIGITMGDPVGIGPEIICKAFGCLDIFADARPFVIGDPGILAKALSSVGMKLEIKCVEGPEACRFQQGCIEVMPVSSLDAESVRWGHPLFETGRAMLDYITTAVDLALKGRIDAMVTAPINKKAMKMAGSPYPGHTELIAERTGCRNYAMMLAGNRLRVVLVTIHRALSSVSGALSTKEIADIIRLADSSLRQRFGIDEPKIAVSGLNPHAGEGGLFGREEIDVIAPAVKETAGKGINVSGPYPPDTVFYQAVSGRFDAVVCMYHDQGLIPFKLIHFRDGVNTTLGLPIIRTSVDHGTAYDIAGQGSANAESLLSAVKRAA